MVKARNHNRFQNIFPSTHTKQAKKEMENVIANVSKLDNTASGLKRG